MERVCQIIAFCDHYICQNLSRTILRFLIFNVFGPFDPKTSKFTFDLIRPHNLGVIPLFNVMSFLSGHFYCLKFVFQILFLANTGTTFQTTLTLSDHSNFVKSRRRPFEQSLFLFRKVMEDAVRDTNSMMTALVQESFPEVKIWNSHLYSDRLRKWVCDECKEDYL